MAFRREPIDSVCPPIFSRLISRDRTGIWEKAEGEKRRKTSIFLICGGGNMSKGENSTFFAKKCVISADTTVIRQMSRNARAGDRIRFLRNSIGDFAVFYFYAAYMRGFTYAALRRVFLSTTAIFVFSAVRRV